MVLVIYIYTSICQIISIVAISTCAEVSMIFSCYQKGEPAGSIADQYHCLIGWMTEGMTEWWNCNMKLWIGLNWLHLQVNIPYWRNWWNGTKRMTLFFPLDSWIGFHPIGDHPIGYIRMSRPDRDGLTRCLLFGQQLLLKQVVVTKFTDSKSGSKIFGAKTPILQVLR